LFAQVEFLGVSWSIVFGRVGGGEELELGMDGLLASGEGFGGERGEDGEKVADGVCGE
jgi:hypothetical protein